MATEDAPAIERGNVYQDRKRPERKLVVIEVEPLKLKNEKTDAVHEMAPATLGVKFKLIGRYIQEGGALKFVALDNIGSTPKTADSQRAAEREAAYRDILIEATRDLLGTERYERLLVKKIKVECPCQDCHEAKDLSFPDLLTSIARMVIRHEACFRSNVLPGLHEDRIDPKKKPTNGEAHA